jgi:probable F420-dependent oxidoreductase
MKFGVSIPNYGETANIDNLVEIAKEAEGLGYDSIAVSDHLLMPVGDNTPYRRTFESITTIAYLAAMTRNIRLSISSLILPLRNPRIVAKQLATLDVISGGRILLAIGVGSYEPEYKCMSSNYHDRGKRQNEYIRLIRALWNGEQSYTSEYSQCNFDGVILEPRPIQKDLEIWIAGSSLAAVRRAIMLGDAWYPNALPFDELGELVSQYRTGSGGKDRKIAMNIMIDVTSDKVEFQNAMGYRRQMLSHDMERNKMIINKLEQLGIAHLNLIPNPSAPISIQLQSLQAFSEKLIRSNSEVGRKDDLSY